MKKELLEVLASEEGSFRLNNISYLRRWTKDGLGNKVDKLKIEFDNINQVNFSLYDTEIKSRDYDSIIKECIEKTQLYLAEVSRSLCSDLKAGYRNKR